MTLRKLSEPKLSELGRLRDSHDFVDLSEHQDAQAIPGMLIVRLEAQIFFANADRLLNSVRSRMRQAQPTEPLAAVMLSLEETPDLDSTALESLRTFAAECRAQGLRLAYVRLKPDALEVLRRMWGEGNPDMLLSELSVDESLQALQQTG